MLRTSSRRGGRSFVGNAFVWKLLFLMFSVEFVKGALLVSLLPIYANRTLGLSAYVLGWAFALQYVGDNVFRIPVGRAIDRFGYRLPMTVGLCASAAGVAALAWMQSGFGLLAGCFLLGAGTSPLWPCVVAGATDAAGEEASGAALSNVYLASFLGTGCGPLVANALSGEGSMRLSFSICLALSAVAAGVGGSLPARGISGRRESRPGPDREGALRALRDVPHGTVLFPAMFLQTLALGLLTPVVTLYAREELGLKASEFSLLLATGGGAALALLPIVGRLSDRRGTRPFLMAGIPLTAAATAFFAFAAPGWHLYAAVAAVAVGYALLIPSWNAFLAHAIPKARRGAAWGAFLAIEGSGFVAGPIASGWLWERVSRQAPFLASAAALLGMLGLYLSISFRKSNVIR
ncbi:MFS transporter [Paenibacillus sp.]|uniref:MFS transporter n=1 Tax=Paenibacillus sp. TaxID=58172 RepID=UPI002D220243|nr:MFS transporter [Paenibacillus sp.]HZG56669.1 MFS transporter [Paenibacillus sp.]